MVAIVQVNVSQQVGPTPSTLQQTGAIISQGATTKAEGTLTLLTQLTDATAILTGGKTISTLTWSTNTVTATTTAAHGFTIGDTIELTIVGATPAGYNGTFLATVASTTTFTYPLVVNPGTMTAPGTYTPEDVTEYVAMATTFFAQGSGQSVYVLELGAGSINDGVAALTTWISNNLLTVYSYLVPRGWDANANFLAFLASYESPTAKTYFYVTTTPGTYTSYTPLMKCVKAWIEAPGIPSTEFSAAADWWVNLHYAPSNTNRLSPNAFAYVFGVTPYPTVGNYALLANLKTAGVNVVGTGAEGGISNAIVLWGTTMDVRDFGYWYSVDWVQLQADRALANAIINGSNNPVNPLYYDQNGINRLQAVLVQTMTSAMTFGIATGTVTQTELDGPTLSAALDSGSYVDQAVVNAVPFVTYSQANPGDYKIGRYAGLSVVYIPARGFIQIVFNLVVSDFVTV